MSVGPPPLPPDVPPPVPPDPPPIAAPPRPRIVAPGDTRGHGGVGFVIALVAQLLQIPIAFLAIPIAQLLGESTNEAQWAILVPLCFFGLTQWLFIVPIGLWLRARGKTNTAFGVWITAGVLFGLNAACLGLLFGLAW
jgi:hypothetical protein